MTRVQRAYSMVLAMTLLGVIAFLPETFFLQGNLYRHFPVYRFLEEKRMSQEEYLDQETLLEITERNIGYAQEMAEKKKKKEKDQIKKGEKNSGADRQQQAETEGKKQESEETEMILVPDETEAAETSGNRILEAHPVIDLSAEKLAGYDYLLSQFFVVDENTSAKAVELNAENFLKTDLTLKKDNSVPQILIYHSHSAESFADSREGEEEDSVVGVGNYLAELLERDYGYQVLHVKEAFDLMSGNLDRSKAYDYAREYVEKVLKENPSVEVVIDLHRDGIPENRHLFTTINGKKTARILFYNGLSFTKSQGKVSYLPNPYIQENLAFSFQLEYECAKYYPDLYRGIYLAGLRYNLHLKPRTLLLEAGAQTNTVQEVKNAMEPVAFLLNQVLEGKVSWEEDR